MIIPNRRKQSSGMILIRYPLLWIRVLAADRSINGGIVSPLVDRTSDCAPSPVSSPQSCDSDLLWAFVDIGHIAFRSSSISHSDLLRPPVSTKPALTSLGSA